MSGFSEISLRQAVAMLEVGETSPAELVDIAFAAVERCSSLNAFVALDEERARREAELPQPGPLRGVPVAVKDLIDVRGLPTRSGTAASPPAPATRDAEIVTRLRRAGAIIVGKTATHELAYGTVTPGVVNPLCGDRIAGGSSGGSAAAVAGGVVPLALGTDTAGSVRIPAVCCGVSGLIASPGALPHNGIMPLSPSFDTLGPIVRGPRDCALAWAALSGDTDVPGDRLLCTRITPSELLGRVDDGAAEAMRELAERLGIPWALAPDAGAGAPPPFREWAAPRSVVIGAEALQAHRNAGLYPDRADQLGSEILASHAAAEARDDSAVDEARGRLEMLAHRLRAATARDTVLLTPALPSSPPRVESVDNREAGRLTRFLAPVNAAGLAAAVVPVGPCGVQLIARDVPTLLTALGRL